MGTYKLDGNKQKYEQKYDKTYKHRDDFDQLAYLYGPTYPPRVLCG